MCVWFKILHVLFGARTSCLSIERGFANTWRERVSFYVGGSQLQIVFLFHFFSGGGGEWEGKVT
jgi:hypothetical protein